MKGFWRRLVSTLVIVGSTWITLLACAHDDSTLFVFDVLQGTVSGSTCSFTSDPAQPVLSSGVLDVALTNAYVATYLVGNQMVAQANPNTPTTETSFITIDHANVRITSPDGSVIRQYSTVTAATIFPATGTSPSFAPVQVPTIDQLALMMIPVGAGSVTRVETFVQFFGKTTGGLSVESNTFEFPVDICETSLQPVFQPCLVRFPVAEDVMGNDPKTGLPIPQPNCRGAAVGGTSTLTTPCTIGQDAPVDCSLCNGNPACNQ